MLYLEMIHGQWLLTGHIQVWQTLVPWLGGLNCASMLVNARATRKWSPNTAWGLQVSHLSAPQALRCTSPAPGSSGALLPARPKVCFWASLNHSAISACTMSYLLPWDSCPLVRDRTAMPP